MVCREDIHIQADDRSMCVLFHTEFPELDFIGQLRENSPKAVHGFFQAHRAVHDQRLRSPFIPQSQQQTRQSCHMVRMKMGDENSLNGLEPQAKPAHLNLGALTAVDEDSPSVKTDI